MVAGLLAAASHRILTLALPGGTVPNKGMRRRVLFVVLGAAVLLLGSWIYVRGQQEAERKLRDLRRQLQEAEAASHLRTRNAEERLQDLQKTRPPASGGAPALGPTDFPLRDPKPPAPIEEFLRKEPKQ